MCGRLHRQCRAVERATKRGDRSKRRLALSIGIKEGEDELQCITANVGKRLRRRRGRDVLSKGDGASPAWPLAARSEHRLLVLYVVLCRLCRPLHLSGGSRRCRLKRVRRRNLRVRPGHRELCLEGVDLCERLIEPCLQVGHLRTRGHSLGDGGLRNLVARLIVARLAAQRVVALLQLRHHLTQRVVLDAHIRHLRVRLGHRRLLCPQLLELLLRIARFKHGLELPHVRNLERTAAQRALLEQEHRHVRARIADELFDGVVCGCV